MPNRGLSSVVCLGLSCITAAWSQQYTVTTLAGNGSAGFADVHWTSLSWGIAAIHVGTKR